MSGRSQRGQALVAVMVVMLIVFALAGAVSIGASALLSQQANQRALFGDDLARQNAVTDAVAQVTGAGTAACGTTPATSPTTLTVRPRGWPSPSATAYCVGLPNAAPDPPAYAPVRWDAPTCPNVTSVDLYTLTGRRWVFFDARTKPGDGWAYVDQQPGVPAKQCSSPKLLGCSTSCPICSRDFSTSTTSVAPVALDCGFGAATAAAFLHIRNPLASPRLAFLVGEPADGGGTLYLLSAQTGLLGGSDFEEAVMFVGGGANQLRYEGRLP